MSITQLLVRKLLSIAIGEYGVGRLLAYAIAGHHGGQPNGIASSQGAGSSLTPLEQRLQKEVEPYDAFFDLLDESDLLDLPQPMNLACPSFLIAKQRRAMMSRPAAFPFTC